VKKGLLWCLLLSILVVGCSKTDSKVSELSLNDVIQVFKDKGFEVDPEEKPMFQMIGADDGVIFTVGNSPVKIYQFSSVNDLKKAKSSNELIKDWPSVGRILLESRNDEVLQIFESLK